jgi:uncharacterized integral membrane protein
MAIPDCMKYTFHFYYKGLWRAKFIWQYLTQIYFIQLRNSIDKKRQSQWIALKYRFQIFILFFYIILAKSLRPVNLRYTDIPFNFPSLIWG